MLFRMRYRQLLHLPFLLLIWRQYGVDLAPDKMLAPCRQERHCHYKQVPSLCAFALIQSSNSDQSQQHGEDRGAGEERQKLSLASLRQFHENAVNDYATRQKPKQGSEKSSA